MKKINPLYNKKILLGVTGSVAATKSLELSIALKELGAHVQIAASPSGELFLNKSIIAKHGIKLYSDIFADDITQMDHITLAKWADIFLIAPATASLLSRCACGLGDQLLPLIYLATTAPIWFAPAMNQQMWSQPAVQTNIEQLKHSGHTILGPTYGLQACGDIGWGRMLEPNEIISQLQHCFTQKAKGYKVVITAGPTQEPIDPVRYLSNHSSGKMGYTLAEAFAQQGAEVTLISGPTNLSTQQATIISVKTTEEMLQAAKQYTQNCDIFIMAAAVADYRPTEVASQKIKKSTKNITLELTKNPDILKSICTLRPDLFTVGFALETQDLLVNATNKLKHKQCNMIIANQLKNDNPIFNSDHNQITILIKDKKPVELPQQSKIQLANQLSGIIRQQFKANTNSQSPSVTQSTKL